MEFLQSLSMTASNERWLAERLLESADAKAKLLEGEKLQANGLIIHFLLKLWK